MNRAGDAGSIWINADLPGLEVTIGQTDARPVTQ